MVFIYNKSPYFSQVKYLIMQKNLEPKIYELSGGGEVSVYKPFGQNLYFALVTQHGRYPESGKIGKNVGRSEFSIVLEGKFKYCINGESTNLEKDQSVMVPDGAAYWIEGSGRILVMIDDKANGQTLIEDIGKQHAI